MVRAEDFGGREIREIHLHHDGGGTELDSVDEIEEDALSRTDQRFARIPYHLIVRRPVVEADGLGSPLPWNPWTIEAGRPLSEIPASIRGRNAHAVAIVVAGHWHDQPLPRWAQDRVVEACVAVCRAAGLSWTDVYGHRELAATLCPGYDVGAIRERVRAILEGA